MRMWAAALLCTWANAAPAYSVLDSSQSAATAISDAVLSGIADEFADPVAVQFRRLRMGREDVVCGELNAKNGYGAYVGFQPFYAFIRNGQTLPLQLGQNCPASVRSP